MDHVHSDPLSPPPPHSQGKRPVNCFSHCFGDRGAPYPAARGDLSPPPCPPSWALPKPRESPRLRRRLRGPASGLGRRRPGGAGGFRYDPLSYALNFDDGLLEVDGDGEISYDEFRYRSFSYRLPASPPQTPPAVVKDVACI